MKDSWVRNGKILILALEIECQIHLGVAKVPTLVAQVTTMGYGGSHQKTTQREEPGVNLPLSPHPHWPDPFRKMSLVP